VPYGREGRDSGVSTLDDRDRDRDELPEPPDTASDYPMSPESPPGGLSGLRARLGGKDDNDDDYPRSSPDRDRDRMDMRDVGRGGGNRASEEEAEKIRREYEARISTMQTQISSLQREREDADERERTWMDGEARVRQMEEELSTVRRRAEEQTVAMRALQRELDDLRDTRQREMDKEARRAQEDEDELRILRDRCERLEEERENAPVGGGADPEIVDQLRNDMEGLLMELGDLSSRNDELMAAKDADLVTIRDLDSQLKDYKRKYEQAKTELRSVKGTCSSCVYFTQLTVLQQRRNYSYKRRRWTEARTSYPSRAMAACSTFMSRPSSRASMRSSRQGAPTPRRAF
jgi:DNA repair exonuclease SbcCD ATPase subunit